MFLRSSKHSKRFVTTIMYLKEKKANIYTFRADIIST